VPVVATDTPGTRETLAGFGLQVPVDDVAALAAALEAALRGALAPRLAAARAHVARHHEARRLARRVARLHRRVLQADGPDFNRRRSALPGPAAGRGSN
jgi:glycosyltransferase involved in cell wall biosynthesis